MFTVILYDDKFASYIEEYYSFFKPYIDDGSFALCLWNTEGETVTQALPELYDIVGDKKEWRAVVLNDTLCDERKNPFDFFNGDESAQIIEENPLIRLTHMLSVVPHKMNFIPKDEDLAKAVCSMNQPISYDVLREDKDYYKNGTSNYELDCFYPVQITIVSTRKKSESLRYFTNDDDKERYESLFWDRNDYPSNVRFLVYDLSVSGKRVSSQDIFEMLQAIIILCINDIYVLKLDAYKLYNISVNVDERKLENIFTEFDERMFHISNQINHLKAIIKEREYEKQFKGELPSFDKRYDVEFPSDSYEELIIKHDGYGLAKDCPSMDIFLWDKAVSKNNKAFDIFKKQPLRCLKRSIKSIKAVEEQKNNIIRGYFDEFQLEDAKETMERIERSMFEEDIAGGIDFTNAEKKRNSRDKAVRSYMKIRMPKKDMIFAGSIGLLLFVAGFIPFMVLVYGDAAAMAQTFLMLLLSVAAIGAAGVFAMYLKLRGLHMLISNFNGVMYKIIKDAKENQDRYSNYISAAFNYKRYWNFKKQLKRNQDEYLMTNGIPTIPMLKRHRNAVKEGVTFSARIKMIYGCIEVPVFDFESEVEYNLTVSPEDTEYYIIKNMTDGKVEYNHSGSKIKNSYEFIEHFSIEKEAVYD